MRITRGRVANTISVVQHCDIKMSLRTQEVSTRIFAIFTLSFACLAGCVTTEPVAPYERGHLSETGMAWEPDSRNAKLKGHVYTSKEASSGGAGAAGGGCGCN